MNDKIQQLTDKLYQEGLAKGQAEGEQILASARAEAEKILKDARSEADAVLALARKDADASEYSGHLHGGLLIDRFPGGALPEKEPVSRSGCAIRCFSLENAL